jgi:hypothetical protein
MWGHLTLIPPFLSLYSLFLPSSSPPPLPHPRPRNPASAGGCSGFPTEQGDTGGLVLATPAKAQWVTKHAPSPVSSVDEHVGPLMRAPGPCQCGAHFSLLGGNGLFPT